MNLEISQYGCRIPSSGVRSCWWRGSPNVPLGRRLRPVGRPVRGSRRRKLRHVDASDGLVEYVALRGEADGLAFCQPFRQLWRVHPLAHDGVRALGGCGRACVGVHWRRLVRIGADWRGLVRIGADWRGLARIGADWRLWYLAFSSGGGGGAVFASPHSRT
jgi:hypothetical protein